MAIARFARRPSWGAALAALALVLVASQPAAAQTLGTWSTAIPYQEDEYAAGAFVLLGEPIGLVGHFRTGIGARTDIGIQIGFPDLDFGNETLFGLAGDVKHLFFPAGGDLPVDLGGDLAFGYQTAGGFDLVDLDFGAVASKPLTTEGGTTVTPYGALIFMIGNAEDNTELDLQIRFGLDYPWSPTTAFLTELNLGSREETISISAGLMVKL